MGDNHEPIDELSRLFGRFEEQIKTLFKKFDELEERSTAEHRAMRQAVSATSAAVRTLTETIKEMKPLTDDYREKRAEARGARKLMYVLVAMFGGVAGAVASKVIDWVSIKPHP